MKYLSGVTTIRLDSEKCKGCGACLDVCPHELLILSNGKIEITDKDACMECGACKTNCPYGAIEVTAGVGCAAAIIGASFKKSGSSPCCG
jgi:NAD-dependent dihydropyrimidine dehydrogenase PreA subunit